MLKLFNILLFVFLITNTSFCQEAENLPDQEDTIVMPIIGDTLRDVSIFTGRYKQKSDSLIESKAILLVSKAYLLAGPDWDAAIITHLKEGSRVLVENTQNGWSFIRVYSEPGNDGINEKRITGFLNNKALGMDKKGKPNKK